MSVDTASNTTFLLIRHGETNENQQKLMQGQQDTLLNDVGIQQANDLAQEILARFPEITHIRSSPLQRALTTAEKTALLFNQTITQDLHFKEISWGVAEGLKIEALDPITTPEMVQAIQSGATRQQRWQYPHFQDAEPYATVLERTLQGIETVAQESPGKTVAIFTHSRVIKILLEHTLDTEDTPKIGNCAIARFTYNPDSSLKFEEVLHLIESNH